MERRNSGLFLLVVYLLLAIYLLPIFPNVSGSANDLTRWATTVSLVENFSFEISWTKDLIGGEFSDVTKTKDGKIYSNKPFGISLLSAPFYAITKVIIGKPTKENIRTSWLVMRFLIGTLPLLFLGIWLYGNEVEAFSLGVLLFATPLFPYSLLYYSHVLVAVLIYMAFRLIYDSHKTLPERSFKAGLLCGFALLCEFSPFAFLSHYELAYPTLSSLYEFSISPSHGLFFFSPILLFSIFTFFVSEHGGSTRHFVKIAAIVFTFVAIIGFAEKYSGNSIGARHLIIIIPLMLDSFFDGEIEDYWSYLRGFLFVISFLFCTIPMLTYAFAPPELQFPHNSFWLPLLYENNFFTTTIANAFGIINNIWTILPAMILLLLAIYFVWRNAKFPLKFAIGLLLGILIVGSYMFLIDLESKTAKPFINKIITKQ